MSKPEVVKLVIPPPLTEPQLHDIDRGCVMQIDFGISVEATVVREFVRLNSRPLIRLADHEAAIAELQEDRDQQYDMKVTARDQRDAMTAERNELLGLLREAREDLAAWMSSYASGDEDTTALIERINATMERHKC